VLIGNIYSQLIVQISKSNMQPTCGHLRSHNVIAIPIADPRFLWTKWTTVNLLESVMVLCSGEGMNIIIEQVRPIR